MNLLFWLRQRPPLRPCAVCEAPTRQELCRQCRFYQERAEDEATCKERAKKRVEKWGKIRPDYY